MTTAFPEPVIELDGVSKRFDPDVLALDGVSLTVRAGEVVVLLGLSGSGKSTLLRHLNGLQRPTAGTVRVLGTDVASGDGAQLRRLRSRIGFVFQQFHLVGSLTVLENVCTGASARCVVPGSGCSATRAHCAAQRSSSWTGWGLPTSGSSAPTPSPAASSSGWPWPGRSCSARRSCSPTSRSPRWTRSPRHR
jgi:ABC-type methionine transport system ATPase subunit